MPSLLAAMLLSIAKLAAPTGAGHLGPALALHLLCQWVLSLV